MTRTLPTALRRATLALALAPASLGAQIPRPPTVLDCQYQLLIAPAPDTLSADWRTVYPAERLAALQPMIEAGRWLELLDALRASFEAHAEGHAGSSDPAGLDRFRSQLDTARLRVQRLVQVPTSDAFSNRFEDLRRVGPATFAAEVSGGRATLFRGTGSEIILDDATPVGLRRTICYHAALERALLDRFTRSGRQAAAAVLTAKRTAWENYFANGYSQLPWELYINSLSARDGSRLDPPRSQWVVLHPSVAMQIAGPSYRDLSTHEAISLEIVGFIRYRDPVEFDDYLGVSGTVVFTDDLGTGVGPFLHFGPAARLGYVFPLRRIDANGVRRFGGVLLTVDLYKHLIKQHGRVDALMDRFRTRLVPSPPS